MTTTIEPEEQRADIPPVSPEEELTDGEEMDDLDEFLAESGADEGEEDEPAERGPLPKGRKRRSPKKKRKPKQETIDAQRNTRELTLLEWFAEMDRRWGWDGPGVECHLHRLYPRSIGSVPTGGYVDKKAGTHFSEEEIQERYGGGEYEMQIIVPNKTFGKPPRMSRKRFSINGQPKVSPSQMDAAQAEAVERGVGSGGFDKTGAALYAKERDRTERLWGKLLDEKKVPAGAGGDLGVMQQVFEQGARSQVEAAHKLVTDKEAAAVEARRELDRVKQDLRRNEEDMRSKIQEATSKSTDLLGALIPSLNDSAVRQVENLARTYEAREARIEEGHAKETQQQARFFEAQMQNLSTMHQAEMARLEASWMSQRSLLEGQLQHYQLQHQTLTGEVQQLRAELMANRIQQVESLQRDRDPATKLGELAQFKEMAAEFGLGGGGGGDDPLNLGEDAQPWMKLINNAISQGLPVVQAALNRGQQPQAAATPPQLPPHVQQHAQALVQQGIPPEQAIAVAQNMAAQQPEAAAEPAAPPPATKLKRSELEGALSFLSLAFKAGTSAEQVITAALQHPDVERDTLRVLADKDPDRVIREMSKAKLLDETMTTTEGREYLKQILILLPDRL